MNLKEKLKLYEIKENEFIMADYHVESLKARYHLACTDAIKEAKEGLKEKDFLDFMDELQESIEHISF